jgi:hypothetical protein
MGYWVGSGWYWPTRPRVISVRISIGPWYRIMLSYYCLAAGQCGR